MPDPNATRPYKLNGKPVTGGFRRRAGGRSGPVKHSNAADLIRQDLHPLLNELWADGINPYVTAERRAELLAEKARREAEGRS